MIGRLFYLMVIGVLLFTVDGFGQNTWVKTYGGSGNDDVYSITPTKDGGFILFGKTESNDGEFKGMNKGHYDILVIKLNSKGDLDWKKTFGGSHNDICYMGNIDYGHPLIKTIDDGYLITGKTSSFRDFCNTDEFDGEYESELPLFVMKLNSYGEIIWKRVFYNLKEYSINTSVDGGYLITGGIQSNYKNGLFSNLEWGNGLDIFVIKLDISGNIVWKNTIGGYGFEKGMSIVSTNDGGYLLTGSTTYSGFNVVNRVYGDIFVIKMNSFGDVEWKKTFGGKGDDGGLYITSTNDGGSLIIGLTKSNDEIFQGLNKGNDERYSDIFVLKLNSDGDIQWKKTIGGSGSEILDYESLYLYSNDGLVIMGRTSSSDGDFSETNEEYTEKNIFIIKLNYNGVIEWNLRFIGTGLEDGLSLVSTNDGGYLLTCGTSFNGENIYHNDIFIVKISRDGKIVWKKSYGGWGNDRGTSIVESKDNGIVVTGMFSSNDNIFSGMNNGYEDIFVMKLDKNGNLNKK